MIIDLDFSACGGPFLTGGPSLLKWVRERNASVKDRWPG
jgi:hypothetical protein